MRAIPATLAFLTAASVALPSAAATNIGTAGAANTLSSGTPPAGATRRIEIGAQIVQDEKVETSASGSVQVLFIDKTTLNVGPSTSIVIDRFVFDPLAAQGSLMATVSQGVLRVVGGLATHTGGATVTTPVAVLGIRGGIATITHSRAKGTRAILGFGRLTITSRCAGAPPVSECAGKTVTLTRPGSVVEVGAAGEDPSEPFQASASDIASANSQLTSRIGQTGGATVLPSDGQAQAYNVGTPRSAAAPIAAPITGARGSNIAAVVQASQRAARQGVQSAASNVTATAFPKGAPAASYEIITNGPYGTTLGNNPAPYLTGNFSGTGTFTVSPILGYQAGGLNANGTPNTTSRQFQAGLGVAGQGASQNATLFVMTSQIENSPNIGFNQAGGFTATTLQGGERYAVGYGEVASATSGSATNSVPTNSAGLPVGSYSLNNYAINQDSGTVSSSQSLDGNLGAYTFNTITTSPPSATAISHPALTLQGYATGLMVTESPGGYTAPYIVTNVSGTPGDVSIYLPANSSQMGAIFNVASLNPPPGSSTTAGGLSTASYQFGSYSPSDPNNAAGRNTARGAYINPTEFAGRASTIFDNGANLSLSSRNGQVLSTSDDNANQLMVTATAVGANTADFLSSISSTAVQACACESTQWGFWATYNGVQAGKSTYFEDQGNLLLWVAGVPTTFANIPVSGTATYSGHAIADISSNGYVGTSYIAAGIFTNTVNFGARTGAVAINGLDNTNYAGRVALTPNTTLFAGTLAGNTGARTATLAGSFFRGGATNGTPLYGEMGGSINLTGTNYIGSGIFAARKP
jgi:hypothetical protein